jgi:hypothetical protein
MTAYNTFETRHIYGSVTFYFDKRITDEKNSKAHSDESDGHSKKRKIIKIKPINGSKFE